MTAGPIVVATDGSEESLRAVDWAAREAELRGLPLRIVSAAALPPRMAEHQTESGVPTVADTVVSDRDRALAAATQRATAAAPDILVDADGLGGSPARAITEAGSGASMLVVGSRGMGAFTALILGSVSRYAAAHAACPVVVVREQTTAAHPQVGVGIGDPTEASAALAFAFEEAALRKASLIAVHALDSGGDVSRASQAMAAPGAHALEERVAGQLQALLADWQTRYPDVQASYDFVHGHPGRALVGLSARADLVVLGRHRPDGLLPGPGAVRHAVLNHAHGPVVTVP
jgi:nucleotide-binding universal stress UspA family protein